MKRVPTFRWGKWKEANVQDEKEKGLKNWYFGHMLSLFMLDKRWNLKLVKIIRL